MPGEVGSETVLAEAASKNRKTAFVLAALGLVVAIGIGSMNEATKRKGGWGK